MPRIAEIDRAILAHLRKNGRMSYVELARDISASERTIRTHIKKMEEKVQAKHKELIEIIKEIAHLSLRDESRAAISFWVAVFGQYSH